MGAPKKYDRQTAIDRARDLFWERGYASTSMSELSKAMGLNASSIYHEFGSKRGLFLLAIDSYKEVSEGVLRPLREGQGLEALEAYFEAVVDGLIQGGWDRGCMMVNSCSQMDADDEELAGRVRANIAAHELAIRRVLREAVETGQLVPDADIEALSRYFSTVGQGLSVVARATRDADRLREVVDLAFAALPRRSRTKHRRSRRR